MLLGRYATELRTKTETECYFSYGQRSAEQNNNNTKHTSKETNKQASKHNNKKKTPTITKEKENKTATKTANKFATSKGSSGVCLLVDCLTSQQHASVSQGRICSDNFTCCHTETEVADPTFYLTQSQCTDTGPTCPSADPITPGAWQGSHWSANF